MRVKNFFRKPEERTISFGKYRGKKYSDVPASYLRWIVSQAWNNWADRKRWAQEELDRRSKKQ